MLWFRTRPFRSSAVIQAVFFVLVVIKSAAYWIGSAIQRPNDPLSTIVLYRGKDIESFPIVKTLGHFGLGEPALYETYNHGVLQERLIPWIGHAFLFRFLGASGFIVADLLLTPLRFVLLSWVLRLSGVGRSVAIAVSAVLTCSAIDDFGEVFPRLAGIPIRFWGLRLPRPYVSELILLLAVAGALTALNAWRERRHAPTWAWALAGGALAVLFQSDLYSATGLALAFVAIVAIEWLATPRANRAALFRGALTAAGVAIAFGIIGVLQSALTNPEGIVRLGLFPISRLDPPVIDAPRWYAATAGLMAIAWLLSRQSPSALGARAAAQSSGRLVLLATCVGGLVAMPLTSILLGKGIELYHYRDAFTRYFSLALVVVGLHVGERVWHHVRQAVRADSALSSDADQPDGFAWAIIVPAALLCVLFAARFAISNPQRSDHMRSDFAEWAALSDYRQPFVDLARELSADGYEKDLVLGTFDHQVWSWWVTFERRYSYLADACTSNASDAELERRTIQLAKLMGMTRAEFVTFARRRYVMIFWMSCAKYQGTTAYSYAPLEDYTEEDRRQITSTPDYLNFTVALPLSQQERLADLFDATDVADMTRLDLVVLTKDDSVARFAPPSSDFELTYENSLFRVWQRRESSRPAAPPVLGDR